MVRRIFISEMDPSAADLAQKWDAGVETIAFCDPANMENEDFLDRKKAELACFADRSLHAPYYELTPCAIDPLIGRVSMHRYEQALQCCLQMDIERMIVHSGYGPQVYFPEWFVPQSIPFWREFAQKLPPDFTLLIENVLDVKPEYIMRVADGVDDPRVKICLDIGHANAYSDVPVEDWLRMLGSRIGHVHLHNNFGDRDAHNDLQNGTIDMQNILALLDDYAPDAALCIESMHAAACCDYLEKKGYL